MDSIAGECEILVENPVLNELADVGKLRKGKPGAQFAADHVPPVVTRFLPDDIGSEIHADFSWFANLDKDRFLFLKWGFDQQADPSRGDVGDFTFDHFRGRRRRSENSEGFGDSCPNIVTAFNHTSPFAARSAVTHDAVSRLPFH